LAVGAEVDLPDDIAPARRGHDAVASRKTLPWSRTKRRQVEAAEHPVVHVSAF
jgi:hypothetical protein